MKIKLSSIAVWLIFSLFSLWHVFAWTVDHFEVIVEPTKSQVGETVDITIEAQDSDDKKVSDYKGTIIIFSETEKDAEFPNDLQDNTYEFTSENQWSVKFENAVKFKTVWNHTIQVYDLNNDKVLWIWEVEITGKETTQSAEINVLSPETWITIWENSVNVSWQTQKNHRVILSINGTEEITTTSNNDGVFEKRVEWLKDGENSIVAYVLNADNTRIGQSLPVLLKIDTSNPLLSSIKITPSWEVESEAKIDVELIASPWLTSVSIIVDDILTSLNEVGGWKYTWTFTAPKDGGSYTIWVKLKNELGKELNEKNATTFTVKPTLEIAPEEPKVETGAIVPEVKDPLKIDWIKLTVLKTKSMLTWEKNEKAESYNIYKKNWSGALEFIVNVVDPYFEVNITGDKITYDYFAIKGVGKTGSWETYEWDLSEATKIQTGPELYFLLILLSLIGGWIFISRKKVRF